MQRLTQYNDILSEIFLFIYAMVILLLCHTTAFKLQILYWVNVTCTVGQYNLSPMPTGRWPNPESIYLMAET